MRFRPDIPARMGWENHDAKPNDAKPEYDAEISAIDAEPRARTSTGVRDRGTRAEDSICPRKSLVEHNVTANADYALAA